MPKRSGPPSTSGAGTLSSVGGPLPEGHFLALDVADRRHFRRSSIRRLNVYAGSCARQAHLSLLGSEAFNDAIAKIAVEPVPLSRARLYEMMFVVS